MKADVKSGKISDLYRHKNQIFRSKFDKKSWANTWFLKGEVSGTMSCQATPNGEWSKAIQKTVNSNRKSGHKLQVLEDGGQSVVANLKTSDLSRQDGCIFGDRNCIVKPNQRCDQSEVVYRITCNECSQEIHETYNYVGCTRTSVHARMAGHLKLQNAKNSTRALYRHDLKVHNGDPQGYITEVLGKEKRNLRLYTLEAKHMEKQTPGLSMNDRQESSRRGEIVRLSASKEY